MSSTKSEMIKPSSAGDDDVGLAIGRRVDPRQLEHVVHYQGAEDEAGDENERQEGPRQDMQGKHAGPPGQHGHNDQSVGVDR